MGKYGADLACYGVFLSPGEAERSERAGQRDVGCLETPQLKGDGSCSQSPWRKNCWQMLLCWATVTLAHTDEVEERPRTVNITALTTSQ